MDYGMSFANLVKKNNGLFTSSKQAIFLLGVCNHERIYTSDNCAAGDSADIAYHCDIKGVVEVKKSSTKSIVWKRT